METNGTIFNRNSLWFLDNINCSPKKQSINIEVLKQMMEYNIRFKFVYEDKDDLWFEKIIEELKIDKKQIWIMPIGKTKEEQEEKMKEVIEYCKEKGFNFCPRVHILVYGDKRGT
jgi:7-carboxy-7-deazaguanine synthase